MVTIDERRVDVGPGQAGGPSFKTHHQPLITTSIHDPQLCASHTENEHDQPPSQIHARFCRAPRFRRRPWPRRRSRRKRSSRLLCLQLLHARDAVCAIRHGLARSDHACIQGAQPRQQPPAMHRPRHQDDPTGQAARALRAARRRGCPHSAPHNGFLQRNLERYWVQGAEEVSREEVPCAARKGRPPLGP